MEILCEKVSKEFLPVARRIIVKYLYYERNLSQREIAKIMGISQSLVSLYLKKFRGVKDIKDLNVKKKITNLALLIMRGKINKKGLYKNVCEIAFRYYKKRGEILKPCL